MGVGVCHTVCVYMCVRTCLCVHASECVVAHTCDDDDELMLNVLRCHLTY